MRNLSPRAAWACVLAAVLAMAAPGTGMPRAGARVMPAPSVNQRVPDPANATYIVAGRALTLREGRSAPPGSPEAVWLASSPTYGDLNDDGWIDAAVVLNQADDNAWLAVLLGDAAGKGSPTNPVALGHRILLVGLAMVNAEVVVTYQVHSPHARADAAPTVEAFAVEHGRLIPAP